MDKIPSISEKYGGSTFSVLTAEDIERFHEVVELLLLLIRFFYATLLLIAIFLLFPENNPGGSYLILAEGLLIGGTAHWIHRITATLPVRERSLLSGLSVAVGVLPAILFFPQVNLSITGILALYLGMIGLELILPDQRRIVKENKV